MYNLDENGNLTLHAGDTYSYKVHATRKTGAAWTSADRMLFTIVNASGAVMLQRYYRLDTSLGNGYSLIQFHNSDTDTWAPGQYSMERRYIINPRWTGDAPTGNVTDALTSESKIDEGDVVRTPITAQRTVTINRVYGEV